MVYLASKINIMILGVCEYLKTNQYTYVEQAPGRYFLH
jgi:hypothetical protein